MKLVTAAQMRALEARAVAQGLTLDELMENAGLAVALQVRDLLGDPKNEHVTILVGPGNNGGDGLVATRHLHDWGAHAHVVLASARPQPDPKLDELVERDLHPVTLKGKAELDALAHSLASSRVAVDAVFGTGTLRPAGGLVRSALLALGEAKAAHPSLTILSVDLPSGLDADTGAVDPATPLADLTVVLGFPKRGLYAFPGAAYTGRIVTVDIGIPPHLADDSELELATDRMVAALLPKRPLDSNKGTFGRLLVVAGSAQYLGAPYLACAAAIRSGAGLVTLAAPASLSPIVAAQLPEVTHLRLAETEFGIHDGARAADLVLNILPTYDALLIGCGLGLHPSTVVFLRRLLGSRPLPPLLLDADALNILAQQPDWYRDLPPNIILTPHPGEMARLSNTTVAAIQRDRLDSAQTAAKRWNKTVVLKGAFTLVARCLPHFDGDSQPSSEAERVGVPRPLQQGQDGVSSRVILNPFANPALASAGTGDVLAGVIAGLLAQGLSPHAAAIAGVYLHSLAAEEVRADLGDSGLAASDLLSHLPRVAHRLRAR